MLFALTLTALTQCEVQFHLYVLENNISLTPQRYDDYRANYCRTFAKNAFNHPRNSYMGAAKLARAAPESAPLVYSTAPAVSGDDRWDISHCTKNPDFYVTIDNSEDIISKKATLAPFLYDQTDVPASFFLGEYGLTHVPVDQGTCGSCYCQVARTVLQSLILHDYPFYVAEKQQIASALLNSREILSEQYLLEKSYNIGGKHCAGGEFYDVIAMYFSTQIDTVALRKDVPYVWMLEKDNKTFPDTTNSVKSHIEAGYEINPVYWANTTSGCPKGVILISAATNMGWTTEYVALIKNLLSHGIALSGQMNLDDQGDEAMYSFNFHKNGIFRAGRCTDNISSNHQVTLVGYGKYKGTDVWMFYNSWGTSFGVYGFYYIEIGSNALCHENVVSAVLPRYFNYGSFSKPFPNNDAYREHPQYYTNIFAKKIRRGINGLDNEDGTYQSEGVTWQTVVLILILIVFSLVIIYFFCVDTCCPPAYSMAKPVYVKITPQWVSTIKWEDDCVKRKG